MAKRLFSLSWALGFVFLFLSSFAAFGQGSESFDSPSWSSYRIGTVNFASGTWDMREVFRGTGGEARTGTASCRINDDIPGAFLATPTLSGGVGDFSFYYKELNSGGGTFEILKSVGGGAFTSVGTQSYSGGTWAFYSVAVNEGGADVIIKILSDDNAGHLIIDDVSWTGYSSTTPEINVRQSVTQLDNGTGVFNFGNQTVSIGSASTDFVIENLGAAALLLNGTPNKIAISGANAADFAITQTGTAGNIPGSSQTLFSVVFTPSGNGTRTATISIANNDSDENPYTFTLTGTGVPACTTPSAASNLTFGTVTATSIAASFTGSSADNYLVVRSTSATPPTVTNGATFTGNATYVVVQNNASTSFTTSSLSANTQYYFYVYAYNNTGCAGGPLYAAALTGNRTTNALPTTVQFTTASGTVTEGTATYVITASITNASGSNATSATVSLPSGNARVNGFTSQVLNWAAGDNTNKTITLTVTDNSNCDGPANLAFGLGSVSGGVSASAGATNSFALTVNDNDLTTGTQFGQGFESGGGTSNNWNYTSAGSISSIAGASRTGSSGRRIGNNGIGSDEYNFVNIAGFSNSKITLYTEGVGGLENDADYFEVYVAFDGAAFTATPEVTVRACQNGSTFNVNWNYNANGVAAKTVNGSNNFYNACSSINGYAKIELTLPSGYNTVAVKIRAETSSSGEYFYYDDLTLTGDYCAIPVPTIVTSTNTLNFGNVTVGSNATQTYTVEGSALTDPIVITPPPGYQVSTDGTNFFNTLSLTPTTGTVNTTTISVRFSPQSNVAYNGNITHTSTGATQVNVAVTGTGVSPCATPTNQATNLILNPSAASIAGSFTAAVGGANSYLVVRSTNATLGASPSNTVLYSAGQTLGNGTVVSSATGTTFNASGLTTSTQYYFFVFAYNNTNCSGGPLYKTPALINNATTLASPFVAFDNFDRADNTTVGIPSSGGATAWGENETGGSDEVEVYNNRLDINSYSNDASAWAHFDMSGKYSTTFDNATSELVWMFNMGSTRFNPSGFGANNNYGTAVVIGATNTNFRTSANGYAVILGESGSVDQLRLVYFTGGLVSGTWTNIIADGGDYDDELLAVKVTYNPATSQWSLGTFDGGFTLPFPDPTAVTYSNTSTANNTTYTATSLPYMGPFWNMSCVCGEYASFDNFNIPTAQACQNTWTGATSTNWFDATNWSCGVVPAAIDDVVIPNVSSASNNFPVIDAGLSTTANVHDLTINVGASVTVTANVISGFPQTSNDLEIYGNLTNNGSANWGTGTVTLKGSIAQTVNGNNNFQYLTIDNLASVNIASGTQKVYGTLALKAGTLNTNGRVTIGSNAAYTGLIDEFSPGNNGGINGTINVERYTTNTANAFFYIGAPVGGASISGWGDDFSLATINGATDGSQVIPTSTCSPTALQAGSPYGGLFDYRENAVNTCNLEGWHVRTGAGAAIQGQGFIARVAAGVTIDLAGTFVTGQTITSPVLTKSVNASGRPPGMNLVSNPFAAPIEWQAVAAANSGSVMGTAYFFQTSGPLAGTYVPVNNVLGGNEIGTSQSFIVEAVSNGVTMNFTDNMKRNGANQYLRTGATYDQLLTLDVNGNGFIDRMHVAFGGDFTTAFDSEFDARKLMSKPDQPSMYVNDGSLLYSIYAQPSVNAVQIVPVDFVAGTNGTFTIDADLNAFDPTAIIFLEDRLLGTMTNLRMVSSYTFSATVNDAANRFALHFYPAMLVQTEDATCGGVDGNITFDQPGATEWQLELIDVDGNVVYTNNAFTGNVTVSNLLPSIYTLNLLHASGYTVSKLYLVNGPAPIVAGFTAPATATEGDDVTFTNSTANATSYTWNFGDGSTSTDANPTHAYTYPGEYLVELVVSNGNCQESITQLVTIEAKLGSGIEGVLSGNAKIYAYGTDITIKLSNLENFSTVEVFDLMGRGVVANMQLGYVNGTFVINMENSANGYYFVRLHNGEDIKIEKVFVNTVK